MKTIISQIEEKLDSLTNKKSTSEGFYYITLHEIATRCKDLKVEDVYILDPICGREGMIPVRTELDAILKAEKISTKSLSNVIATLVYIDLYFYNYKNRVFKGKELAKFREKNLDNKAVYCNSYRLPMMVHALYNLKDVNKYIAEISNYTEPSSVVPTIVHTRTNLELFALESKLKATVAELRSEEPQVQQTKEDKTMETSNKEIQNAVKENIKYGFKFKSMLSNLSDLATGHNNNSNLLLADLYNTAWKAHTAAYELCANIGLKEGYKISVLDKSGEVDVVGLKDYVIKTTNPESVLKDAMSTLRYYRREYNNLGELIKTAAEDIEDLKIQ